MLNAHRYMLGSVYVGRDEVEKYGTFSLASSLVFYAAWYQLYLTVGCWLVVVVDVEDAGVC